MEISCAFATALDSVDHIVEAERLGYARAWCYDSPGLYPDVWMVLARAAERTARIGLGPGVLVPALRHPMVNAAAIATLEALAPGRVTVGIGSGFTGRMVLGQRAMAWRDVASYVRALRGLLRGETVTWDGAAVRMLHERRWVGVEPAVVPIVIGADGPKGMAVAAELGDGVFSAGTLRGEAPLSRRVLLTFGTVLDDGEDVGSPRARAAWMPGVAVAYHATYERRGAAAVDRLPGGQAWREAVEAVPEGERHLAIHEGHLVAPNARDERIGEGAAEMARLVSFTGTAAELRTRLDALATAGVTEVAYQPAGPDIRRELAAFAAMAGLPAADSTHD